MSHLYTIFLLFSSLRFIMIDSQATEIERRGEPQTFYFRSFWLRPPSFARDSMDSLWLEFFPWNNEEEIYVLPIKAHWTGLECFYALAVLTFPAADWTRSESRCLMSRANPTSLLSWWCCLFVLVWVPDTTEEHFNLSTAKCTTQRRLRSHLRLTRSQSTDAGVFLFLLCAFNPCLPLLFQNWFMHPFRWNQFMCNWGCKCRFGLLITLRVWLTFYCLDFALS